MKYFSKEDDECSHKYVNCIINLLKTRKPFYIGYVFKSHCYSINEGFSIFKVCVNLEEDRRYIHFQHIAMTFLPSLKKK